jgi:hypothetical protein
MAAKVLYEWHYERIPNANGKLGKRVRSFLFPYCPVRRCEWCQRIGSPTWIRRWNIRLGKSFDLRVKRADSPALRWPQDPSVCIGCMSRVRQLWLDERIIEENRLLIGRIRREMTRVNNEHRRGSAPPADGNARGRPFGGDRHDQGGQYRQAGGGDQSIHIG